MDLGRKSLFGIRRVYFPPHPDADSDINMELLNQDRYRIAIMEGLVQHDIQDPALPSIKHLIDSRFEHDRKVPYRRCLSYLLTSSALSLVSQALSHSAVSDTLRTDVSWLVLAAASTLSMQLSNLKWSLYSMAGGVVFFLSTRFSRIVAETVIYHSSGVWVDGVVVPTTVPWTSLYLSLALVRNIDWMVTSVHCWEASRREHVGFPRKSLSSKTVAIWVKHCAAGLVWHMQLNVGWWFIMLMHPSYRAHFYGMEMGYCQAGKTLAADLVLWQAQRDSGVFLLADLSWLLSPLPGSGLPYLAYLASLLIQLLLLYWR